MKTWLKYFVKDFGTKLKKRSSEVKPMIMTEDDKIDFDNAKKCWTGQKDFTEKDKKVRDHCHFTGK